MTNETYQHTLWTGSGSNKATLKVLDNGDVEIEFKMHWMGSGRWNYYLYGKHEAISAFYGWIRIQEVNAAESPVVGPEMSRGTIHIEALGVELIYEYVKIASSPVFQHPQQDLSMMVSLGYAGWNESFDLLLLTNTFMLEAFEALKYMMADGTVKELYPAETLEHIDDSLIRHLESLLFVLDKMKFTRVDTQSLNT